jgi:hypothetical protein
MALFYECIQKCSQNVLDTADIVRDGDISSITFQAKQAAFTFVVT